MEQNVGSTDRIVRAVLGVLLAAIGVAGVGDLVGIGIEVSILLAVIGLVLIGTAAFRLCLIYKILGIRTTQ